MTPSLPTPSEATAESAEFIHNPGCSSHFSGIKECHPVGSHHWQISATVKMRSKLSTTDAPPPELHLPFPFSTLISQICRRPVSCLSSPPPPPPLKILGTVSHPPHRYAGDLLKHQFSPGLREGRGRCPPRPAFRGRASINPHLGTTAPGTSHTLPTIFLHLYPANLQSCSTAIRTNLRSPWIPSPRASRVVDSCPVQSRDQSHPTIFFPFRHGLSRRLRHNHNRVHAHHRAGLPRRKVSLRWVRPQDQPDLRRSVPQGPLRGAPVKLLEWSTTMRCRSLHPQRITLMILLPFALSRNHHHQAHNHRHCSHSYRRRLSRNSGGWTENRDHQSSPLPP